MTKQIYDTLLKHAEFTVYILRISKYCLYWLKIHCFDYFIICYDNVITFKHKLNNKYCHMGVKIFVYLK